MRSPKNSHIARPAAKQRQRDERTRQPVDLTAREQPEDDEQRMQAQRAPHHLRDHDVALHLVDPEEQQEHPDRGDRVHDERVEERRNRAEPRTEIRNQLRDRNPGTEEQRVLLAVRKPAEHAEEP